MTDPHFPPLKAMQVAIVGLGLMGGSLGLRLKQAGLCARVVGLARRMETIEQAQAAGAIDWGHTDPAVVLQHADLVILATPVRVLLAQLSAFAPHFKPGAIVTDLGSTKQVITQAMAALPAGVYPVGSHPMCGKETTGLAAADVDLYENCTWVISPLADTPATVSERVEALARGVGANPLYLDPARHDRLVAAISHAPYLLSAGLVLGAQSVAVEDDVLWDVAASGFRDTSRIAASGVTMMLDILLTNHQAVGAMMARLQQQLAQLAAAVADQDEDRLQALLTQARDQRLDLYQ